MKMRFQQLASFKMAKTYVASGGSLVLSAAAQLLTFAILARWFGVDQFSLFVTLMAVANIAVHLCGLGAMESLLRRTAQDPSMYPKLLGHNILLTLPSAFAIIFVGSLVLPHYFKVSDDPIANFFLITLMMTTNILLVRVIVLVEQIFIAHEKFIGANATVLSFAIVRTIAAVTACIVFGVATVASFIFWQFAAHVIVALGAMYAIRPYGRPVFSIVPEEVRQGLYFSIPFILRATRQNVDVMVLNIVSTTEIVASYSVARRIVESSYLSIDALNRLVYPGTAKVAVNGIHYAWGRVQKVFWITITIAFSAAVAVFLLAPLLPVIFGEGYTSLVDFTRVLCWVIIPMAVWVVAIEALGASGNQKYRAWIMGGGSIFGAIFIALGTWFYPPTGTIVAYYNVEILTALVAWGLYYYVMKLSRARSSEVS